MSFDELLTNYINTSCSLSSKTEYLSSNFVSLFENFIHDKTAKIITGNSSKSSLSTSTSYTSNGLQDADVRKVEHSSPTVASLSLKTSLHEAVQKSRRNNFDRLECRIVGSTQKKNFGKNESRSQVPRNSSHKLNTNVNSNPRNKSPAYSLEKREHKNSAKTKRSTLQTSLINNRTLFDISSSNDFPVLSNSLATDMKLKESSQKHKCRRIKPTMIPLKTDAVVISTFDKATVEDLHSRTNIKSSEVNIDLMPEQKSLLNARLTNATQVVVATAEDTEKENSKSTILANVGVGHQKYPIQLAPLSVMQLHRLAEIHSYYLTRFLVPSIITEIHILVTMLLLEANVHADNLISCLDDPLASLLQSPEKVRIFAALCLVNLSRQGFFQLFSTETLNLMVSHVDIKRNLTELTEAVKKELEDRATLQKQESNSQFSEGTSRTSVPFKPDTDDRSNFQTDKAFFGFRKQRDMFYSLLRQWDKNQSSEKASKEAVGQIRWLITQVKSLSTFDAFLRLFVDHLLSIGGAADSVNHSSSDNSPLVLLLNGDSEKFRRLESRVTKASPSQKSNSCDWMYREFQFFRDFVTISDSYTFNIHLCDYLQTRICQIENENFQINEAPDDETAQDYGSVIQAIYDLRILGNFYGLVVFQPYQNGGKRAHLSHIEETSGEFLITSLNRALQNGHLLLTVPWVVQFLHFSFSVLTTSEIFKKISILLQSIYRIRETNLSSTDISQMFSLFIGTVICNLFEQEFYNEDFFYQHLDSSQKVQYEFSSNSVDAASDKILSINIIGEMHWRLADIRSSLKCKTSLLNKRQLPKKITPSTERLPETSNMQAKLEAAFFRNQPLSLKRTVSFVSDRCHSNCVKHLCSDILPRFCRDSDRLKKFAEETSDLKDNQVIRIAANEMYKDAIEFVRGKASLFVEDNTAQCMNVLVSSTVSQPVLQTATQISVRMAWSNVETWLNARLLDHLVANLKLILVTGKNKSECSEHESIAERPFHASHVIHNLREMVISNQKVAGVHDEVEKVVEDQLTVVSQLLTSYEQAGDSLPRHVMAAISYLVKELICTTSTADFRTFVNHLHLDHCHKAILLQVIDDF